MDVKISYSAKRKKTVSARLEGDVLHVLAPSTINKQRLDSMIEGFKEKVLRKKIKKELNRQNSLEKIAAKLNSRYFGNSLNVGSVEYSTSQNKRYGSCNCLTGDIKISSRLRDVPEWVRDYVIVHEMAHIIEPNHGKNFYELVNKYKLAERARGYLMALGMNSGER